VTALHHEHLVRINDPTNSAAPWLSREQLWNALRQTVLAPKCFDPSIDAVTVQQTQTHEWHREIRRGGSTMCDRVEFTAAYAVTIHADRSGDFAGSTLTIAIEEPAPEMLFVRFTYDIVGLEANRNEDEDVARRSAYEQSDIERVRQVRRFASDGPVHH